MSVLNKFVVYRLGVFILHYITFFLYFEQIETTFVARGLICTGIINKLFYVLLNTLSEAAT